MKKLKIVAEDSRAVNVVDNANVMTHSLSDELDYKVKVRQR